jgi:hypothetical protein
LEGPGTGLLVILPVLLLQLEVGVVGVAVVDIAMGLRILI